MLKYSPYTLYLPYLHAGTYKRIRIIINHPVYNEVKKDELPMESLSLNTVCVFECVSKEKTILIYSKVIRNYSLGSKIN